MSVINYPNFDVLVWQVFIVRVGLNHTRARSVVYNSEEAGTIVLCRLSCNFQNFNHNYFPKMIS